jgi:quercetin dioxygenase-like cupin family protein
MERIDKRWGYELIHHNADGYSMKTLVLKRSGISSLHYHTKKTETFLVVEGGVLIQVGSTMHILSKGKSIHIPAGTPHRFQVAAGYEAVIIEAGTIHDEEDVTRIEESRYL